MQCISPGMVVSEFAKRMLGDEEKADLLLGSIQCIQAEDIAQVVMSAIVAPSYVEVIYLKFSIRGSVEKCLKVVILSI